MPSKQEIAIAEAIREIFEEVIIFTLLFIRFSSSSLFISGALRHRDRHLLLLTGSYFALNYFEYIFYYWIYYYFGEIRHMPQEQSAYATTVIFITMAVMTPLGGWSRYRAVRWQGR